MSQLRFLPIATETVRALQAGGPDANGHTPERHVSDGNGNPCRHCLSEIAKGDGYLIVTCHFKWPKALSAGLCGIGRAKSAEIKDKRTLPKVLSRYQPARRTDKNLAKRR